MAIGSQSGDVAKSIKNLGASPEVSVFGEVAAKPRRVQSLHPRSKQRSILARRINTIKGL